MNPAVTLTFYRLGKVRPLDAAGYVVAQVVGATAVMGIVSWTARSWVADASVNFVQTLPGPGGAGVAFAAEAVISLGMMLTVLSVSSSRWAGWTGVCAGCLVALYITVEAPLSGMSMNPARTFGPAFVAGMLAPVWIYIIAPLAGMLAASELHVRLRGRDTVRCAKLHHDSRYPCIFHCTHARETASIPAPAALPADAALPRPRSQAGHEVCS